MKRSENGFTMIEVLLATAIIGIIMPVMALSIATLLINHQQANDNNVVLQAVQNTGYWILRDVQTAKNVTPTEPSGFPLTLDVPVDTNENNDHSIDYLFDGNKLKRKVYDSSHTLIGETLIAEYIDVQNTTFSTVDTNTYNLTTTASKGDIIVERSYRVSQRLSPG